MPSLPKFFLTTVTSAILLASFSVAATEVTASATQQIELPKEEARLRVSELPGYAVATKKCAICHSVDYINYQPPGRDLAQWTGEVRKMHDAYGAPISETDIAQIGAYLAVAYGTAKSTDAAVLAASAEPEVQAGAIDVDALLAGNACLGCHAVDHKVLGPAFQEVAAKYADDAEAAAKISDSIRAGGVGKWGQIPMPPMSGLSEQEAAALAEYILGGATQ